MPATYLENVEPVTPSKVDVVLAKETSQQLAKLLGNRSEYQMQFVDPGQLDVPLRIPAGAMQLFVHMLEEMAKGNTVSLTSIQNELSTQQAALLLNVSRPYLTRLLESGEIPFRKVGTHRRVRYGDVMEYKQRTDVERLKALEALAEQAQLLNMGY